jgi:putative spermidine/putrescine transport system ATP-binding protein
VLYVTHDQGEALTLSDRIAVLDRHRLRQVGTPVEIYDRPETTFIAGFIGETNILDAQREGAGWRVPDLGVSFATGVAPASPAGPHSLLLRPERIMRVAGGEGPPGAVAFAATVADAIFLGDLVRYRIALAGGRRITLQEHRGSGLPLLPSGAAVTLAFMPDDVRILGRDEAAA